jgi:AcrR family transcriptional regulator
MSTARQQAAKKTRDKIIQSAMEIVGKSGYKALTSNALVAQAGVAKGTIYHHFDSLDDVIFAMIRSICSQMVNDISEHQYTSLKVIFLPLANTILMSALIIVNSSILSLASSL